MTVFARIFQHKIQFFLASEDSFLECDTDTLSDISPFHRTVACAASSRATEHISEDISENVAEICSIEVKSAAESTCSAAGTAIKCSVAELIVLTTFVSVTQNGIGFGSLFELYFCFFIPWIHIWMVLLRKLAVCFLDCSIICIFAYAEHLIIISLCLCHNTNTNLSVSLS